MNNDDHKFDRDLAKMQVKATFAATLGSVIVAIGISLTVLGIATNLDAFKEIGEHATVSQIIGSTYFLAGILGLVTGIILLVITEIRINHRIDSLK